MSLNNLRKEAVNNLTVTASIINQQGGDIDIGEEFTVRFSVSNNFNGGDSESRGHAHYNNVQLRVAGTPYASVVGGNRIVDVTSHLGYGWTRSVDIVFSAISKRSNGFLSWPAEPYADVEAIADFDIGRFFRVHQSETFETQIDDG